MPVPQRLPFPYRPEGEVVAHRLQVVSAGLDWAAAAKVATPWVQAVRDNPPPFWAMESLLKEYPISSAEGLALMRLAEALLRAMDSDLHVEHGPERAVNGVVRRQADTAEAWRDLGFRAETGLEEGLRELVDWWRPLRAEIADARVGGAR